MNKRALSGSLQEGIYYEDGNEPKVSLGIVLLRVASSAEPSQIGHTLAKLWMLYDNLKKGIMKDVPIGSKNSHEGNLSVLLGYGPRIFSLNGIKKQMPKALLTGIKFLDPKPNGGGLVSEGASFRYADDISLNHVSFDHILIQFIADTQLATHRAIVETWALLSELESNSSNEVLQFSRFYTGFQRPDKRNWMGFHDGLSNMKSEERKYAIVISNKPTVPSESWTINGTYLAFMRISVDLQHWNMINKEEQEILVGREKSTGCPIIGIDKNNKPVKSNRCPIPSTLEVTEKGNEEFRDHPRYGSQSNLAREVSDRLLKFSHTGSARKDLNIPVWKTESFRIFRQGYEFLEPAESFPGFRVGLNFISFQNTPERLAGSLKDWPTQYKADDGKSLNKYFLVRAAGIFFVPPLNKNEMFPGSSIFTESTDQVDFTVKRTTPNGTIWPTRHNG